jgi:hypothetical protein
MTGSLKTVASELAKRNLDLVAAQEVRWVEDGNQSPDDFIFFYGKGNAAHHLETDFLVQKRIVSELKMVEFISGRMSYVTIRGRWFDIFVLDVFAQTGDKSDNMKDSFYEELESVVDHIPMYHAKNLLRNFNAKLVREDIFTPTIGNENLREINNDNVVRVVKFTISKNLRLKCTHNATFIKHLGFS